MNQEINDSIVSWASLHLLSGEIIILCFLFVALVCVIFGILEVYKTRGKK